jgi:hypothetical protein
MPLGFALLLLSAGSVWWQRRTLAGVEPALPRAAAPLAVAAPQIGLSAAREPDLLVSPPPAVASEPSAVVEAATPKVAEPKPMARARAATAPVPTTPVATAEPTAAMGVVLITTPGGSGEVFEQGQLLGKAPGSFRLKVGAHQLTLRTPSGGSRTLSVQVQGNAPTLVTVPGAN